MWILLILTRFVLQINDVNLWPPFSVTMTPMSTTPACGINTTPTTPASFATGMFPIYYIPAQQQTLAGDYRDPNLTSRFQSKYFFYNLFRTLTD